MNNEKIEQIIRGYIPQIIHMSIATVKDNRPWVCEVHFAYDDDLNLYFVSARNSRHAQELLENPVTAGNITTQHHKNQKTRCVDFEGTVELLDDADDMHPGIRAYSERFEQDGSQLKEIARSGQTGFFKITVNDFFLADSYGEERGKHHLPWKNAGLVEEVKK